MSYKSEQYSPFFSLIPGRLLQLPLEGALNVIPALPLYILADFLLSTYSFYSCLHVNYLALALT